MAASAPMMSIPSSLSDDWNAWAVPAKLVCRVAGIPSPGLRPGDLRHGLAQGHAGPQVEGDGRGGELPLVGDRERGERGGVMGEGGQGDLAPLGRGIEVDVPEARGVLPELGRHLHHDMVLV